MYREKKIKILSVVGTRPNFVKISPLLKQFKKYRFIKSVLMHTGQHYDLQMSGIFFEDLQLPQPDIYLKVGSQRQTTQTARIMIGLERVLMRGKPDLVVVVGDVNSTLAGALVAAKLSIPIAYVEAGLRSFERRMPEEINRVITDSLSQFLFTPSQDANENLKKEGVPLALLEALAYGKPTVATDVGGISEVICNNETGFLVPPKDSAALAEAVGILISDPQRRIDFVNKTRNRLKDAYSSEKIIPQFWSLYHN